MGERGENQVNWEEKASNRGSRSKSNAPTPQKQVANAATRLTMGTGEGTLTINPLRGPPRTFWGTKSQRLAPRHSSKQPNEAGNHNPCATGHGTSTM